MVKTFEQECADGRFEFNPNRTISEGGNQGGNQGGNTGGTDEN